jgi:hypothetical protein
MVERRGDDWKNYATNARFTSNPGENIAGFWPGGLKRLEMLLEAGGSVPPISNSYSIDRFFSCTKGDKQKEN